MVSNNTTSNSMSAWEFRGLHADTKPTNDDIPNGSAFLEIDTGSVFLWDKEGHQWREI